jgi:hypothetical protein
MSPDSEIPLFDFSVFVELIAGARMTELNHMMEDPGLLETGELRDDNNPRYLRWLHGGK